MKEKTNNISVSFTPENWVTILNLIQMGIVSQELADNLSEAQVNSYGSYGYREITNSYNLLGELRSQIEIPIESLAPQESASYFKNGLSNISEIISKEIDKCTLDWIKSERYSEHKYYRDEFLRKPTINPNLVARFILGLFFTTSIGYWLLNKLAPTKLPN